MGFEWTGVADGLVGGLIGGGFAVLAGNRALRADKERIREDQLNRAVDRVEEAAAALVNGLRSQDRFANRHLWNRMIRAQAELDRRMPRPREQDWTREVDHLWTRISETVPTAISGPAGPGTAIDFLETYTNCVALNVRAADLPPMRGPIGRRLAVFRRQRP